MSVLSPNMNLVLSTVNVDSGLNWEQNLNSSLTILDGHNHAAGSGVQIQPSGLNINSALLFNNQQATNVQAVVFAAQTSLATLGSIYTIGADLYYNDANGNVIQITSGGAVNATSSGISSGPATASFVSSVLVVNAASNTPANIQGGSLLLGNNVAATKFLTLAPPSSMGANYTVTLPALPASTLPVTMDTSGNLGTAQLVSAQIASGAVTTTQIASQTIAQGNLALRATGSTVVAGGVATSASCGNYSTTSGTPANVSNLSVTLTTTGRPIFVGLISDGTGSGLSQVSLLGARSSTVNVLSAYCGIALNGGTSAPIALYDLSGGAFASGSCVLESPSSMVWMIDFRAAGTWNYSITLYTANSPNVTAYLTYSKLVAYEL